MQIGPENHTEDLQTRLCAILLDAQTGVQLDDAAVENGNVVLTITSTRAEATCPSCGMINSRIHSTYRRIPGDLAIAGQAVRLHLHVRRFFCANDDCGRKTFAERLPGIIKPFARRTNRLTAALCAIGQRLGGEAGARCATQIGIATSPDTLLRLVCNTDLFDSATPTVLGVDDWAWKKGRSYGTILVDLERQHVVDILPGRSADGLAEWLEQHPGIEIISRDRAGVYAEGARRGAPDAIQVADRFHLLKNLREALEPLLSREYGHLPEIAVVKTQNPISMVDSTEAAVCTDSCLHLAVQHPDSAPIGSERGHEVRAIQENESPPQTLAESVKHARRQRRYARFQQIIELHNQGVSIRTIAQQMGVSRRMVRRYVASSAFPEIAKRRAAPSILDRFEPYLRQRWDEGCHNAQQLFREIHAEGFTGSRPLVSRWASQLRKTLAMPVQSSTQGATRADSRPTKRASELRRKVSPAQAAWLLVCSPDRLNPEQLAALEQMCRSSAEIATAYRLAQEFTAMVRQHTAEPLSLWLDNARNCGLRELHSFATGVQRDLAAVTAGLTLPWSQGQVEGQVNRLKMLKRAMYGRAGFNLLRHRVLAVT